MRIISTKQLLILSMLLMLSGSILGQSTLHGIVADSLTHEALIGASVVLVGTSQGAATNLDGEYKIPNIAEGTYQIRVSYVGYETKTISMPFKGDRPVELFIQLSTRRIEGKTIVVTAQAQGQLEAINQQLTSNKIVNVVSADKMKELPDANIAESIGRLPGISLQRNAGEATAVVVRGLSPKYNQISIEGIPMSSTNYYDRGVDLSLLSDELIKGVEVSKTLRPDMDADALGGTVNLTLKTAPTGLHYDIKGTGAYNKLRNTYNNYKFSGGVSDRIFDNVIGVQLQANIEEKQLPSDQFSAGYDTPSYDSKTNQFYVTTGSATLTQTSTKRHRYGISLILDYTSDFVDVKLFNVYDQKTDSNITRTNQTNFSNNSFTNQILINETKTIQQTHSLQALFKFEGTELPVSLSYTKGAQDIPNRQEFDFLESGAGTALPVSQRIYGVPLSLIQTQGVMNPSATANGSNLTTLNNLFESATNLLDESYDAKADWKVPFKFSDSFSGILSAGGKYHQTNRNSSGTREYFNVQYGGSALRRKEIIGEFSFLNGADVSNQSGIPAPYFVDPTYSTTSILGYPIGHGFDVNKLSNVMNTIYPMWASQFYRDAVGSYNQYYNDKEKSIAGYVMGEFNIGTDLTIVPGVRFQEEKTDISAYHIWVNATQLNGLDALPILKNSKRDNPDWFPSVNIKYKATDNVQILGAVYKSVSLPSYGDIAPLLILQDNQSPIAGNPVLKPSTALNLDLGASLFSNDIGLFTVNGFYKEISDLIYSMQNFYPFFPNPIQGAPAGFFDRLPSKAYFDSAWANSKGRLLAHSTLPMNNPIKAYLRGIEFSWQTHLWYLPGVLSGIVLDLNLSLMSSHQEYPYFAIKAKPKINSPDTLIYATTSGSLQDQPKAIYNAIIGWDYMGFSSRVSFRYQEITLSSVDTRYALEDYYNDNILLVDISLKQKIMEGLSIYANATNINSHVDNSYFSHPVYTTNPAAPAKPVTYPAGQLPSSGQTYGWALQVGVSYSY
jgi:TonB-dependent receptor